MSFILNTLGSSSALPTSTRYPAAHVLNVDERFFLIDCGEAAQIQLRKYKIKFGQINHIFISHLHGDHILGLPGLLSSYSLLGRKKDIHIYAFKEIEQFISCYSGLIGNHLPFKVIVHNLNPSAPEIIYEDNKLTVKSFPLMHSTNTCGFLFKERPKKRNIKKQYVDQYNISIKEILNIKEGADYGTNTGTVLKNKEITFPPYKSRSFAYCCDTVYSESIVPVIKHVDLLYHEATFGKENKDYARKTLHSTATDAALTAKNAHANTLVIGHFSARNKEISHLLEEAREIFPNTHAAYEGAAFEVKQERENE